MDSLRGHVVRPDSIEQRWRRATAIGAATLAILATCLSFMTEGFRLPLTVPDPGRPRPDLPWLAQTFRNPPLWGHPFHSEWVAEIGHDWGDDGPVPGGPTDGFSIEWRGCLHLVQPTRLTLAGWADDTINIAVDDVEVLRATVHGPKQRSVHQLGAGLHSLRVRFTEQGGAARSDFYMEAEPAIAVHAPLSTGGCARWSP